MPDRLIDLVGGLRGRRSGSATARCTGGTVVTHLEAGADPITGGSLFEIGSVTKTVTATLLAVMVGQGRVRLDDEIGAWIDAGDCGRITLEQLATHTSGLPRLSPAIIERARVSGDDPYGLVSAEDVLGDLRRLGCVDRPAPPVYSNVGYMVLGHVLAVAAGQPFEAVVTDQVLQPLDMRTAGFDLVDRPARIPGYERNRPTPHWHHQLGGAGAIEASIDDMAAFVNAQIDPAGSPLGPALELAQAARTAGPAGGPIGLAWHHRGPVIWHNGGTRGFGAFVAFDRQASSGVVVLTNSAHRPSTDRAGFRLLDELARG